MPHSSQRPLHLSMMSSLTSGLNKARFLLGATRDLHERNDEADNETDANDQLTATRTTPMYAAMCMEPWMLLDPTMNPPPCMDSSTRKSNLVGGCG